MWSWNTQKRLCSNSPLREVSINIHFFLTQAVGRTTVNQIAQTLLDLSICSFRRADALNISSQWPGFFSSGVTAYLWAKNYSLLIELLIFLWWCHWKSWIWPQNDYSLYIIYYDKSLIIILNMQSDDALYGDSMNFRIVGSHPFTYMSVLSPMVVNSARTWLFGKIVKYQRKKTLI